MPSEYYFYTDNHYNKDDIEGMDTLHEATLSDQYYNTYMFNEKEDNSECITPKKKKKKKSTNVDENNDETTEKAQC